MLKHRIWRSIILSQILQLVNADDLNNANNQTSVPDAKTCIDVITDNKEHLLEQLKANDLRDHMDALIENSVECELKIRNQSNSPLDAPESNTNCVPIANECSSKMASLVGHLIIERQENINGHQMELLHYGQSLFKTEVKNCKRKLDANFRTIESFVELFKISAANLEEIYAECKSAMEKILKKEHDSWQYSCVHTKNVFYNTLTDWVSRVPDPRVDFDRYRREVNAGVQLVYNHYDAWLRHRKNIHVTGLRKYLPEPEYELNLIIEKINVAYYENFVHKLGLPKFTQNDLDIIRKTCGIYLKEIESQALIAQNEMSGIVAQASADSLRITGEIRLEWGYILPFKSLDAEIARVKDLLMQKKGEHLRSTRFNAELAFDDMANGAFSLINWIFEQWTYQMNIAFRTFDEKWKKMKKYYESKKAENVQVWKDNYETCQRDTKSLIEAFKTHPVGLAAMKINNIFRFLENRFAVVCRCVYDGPPTIAMLDNFFNGLLHESRLNTYYGD